MELLWWLILDRNDNNNKGRPTDVAPLPLSADKTDGTVALVKSGSEKVKTTPAGEYLTSALDDFDPEQYDSLAAISDGANKLLMLVCFVIGFVLGDWNPIVMLCSGFI